jgi:hypothetical protein
METNWKIQARLNDGSNSKIDVKGIGDRPCGLVVRVPGYRSRGPGSIPGATKFSEK